MLNLYRLTRIANYDETDGLIIAAPDGIRARGLARECAAEASEGEPPEAWDTADCDLIGTTILFEEGVIFHSFKAG